MDIRKIKKLIELLEESGIAELEIREGEESVRIARMSTAPAQASYFLPQQAAPAATAPAAALAAPTPAAPAARHGAPGEHVVTAPMVGTYYNAPSPGAKAFVEIGSEGSAGQVLCIIEALKMMNQIESEISGRVRAVLVKNGDPVEFGQPLFILE